MARAAKHNLSGGTPVFLTYIRCLVLYDYNFTEFLFQSKQQNLMGYFYLWDICILFFLSFVVLVFWNMKQMINDMASLVLASNQLGCNNKCYDKVDHISILLRILLPVLVITCHTLNNPVLSFLCNYYIIPSTCIVKMLVSFALVYFLAKKITKTNDSIRQVGKNLPLFNSGPPYHTWSFT